MSTGSARLGAVTFLATAGAVVGALLVHSAAAEPQRVSAHQLSRVVGGVQLSMNVPLVGNGTTGSRSPGTRSDRKELRLFSSGRASPAVAAHMRVRASRTSESIHR